MSVGGCETLIASSGYPWFGLRLGFLSSKAKQVARACFLRACLWSRHLIESENNGKLLHGWAAAPSVVTGESG